MIALDANVLIALCLGDHVDHDRAARAYAAVRAGPRAALVPVPALIEAFSVLTRLPPPWRLPSATALEALRHNLHGCVLASLAARDGWALLESLVARGLGGGIAHDAHVAAVASAAGATEMVTFNRRDFERVDLRGMRLVVPE